MELSSNNIVVAVPPSNVKFLHNNDNLTLKAQYHMSEISQNEKIVNTAIRVIYIGIGIIAIGVILAFTVKLNVGILTCIFGGITEFISGGILWMVGKSVDEKLNYFSKLTKADERDKLLEVINSSPNVKFREKMIERLVENHCNK